MPETIVLPNRAARDAIVRDLRQVLPANAILHEEEDTRAYECDGLTAARQRPWIVVLPETTAQIQSILAYCNEEKIPLVARGAGTGLSGGALPHQRGILLSLARLNRILQVDPAGLRAVVEPGVTNLAISRAAAPHGLYYAPDPSSQIACTIGGNVAENSGGVHCLKYGLTVHNIQQVKMVCMDGELVTIGSTALDSPGYDLLALLNGSEGLLGIIVEITVKLLPRPGCVQLLLAGFEQLSQAGDAVARIIAEGIIPAGLEMMDRLAIRAAEDFVHAGYPVDAAAILLCEIDGTQREVEETMHQVNQLMLECGATTCRIAREQEECARLWQGRKAAFPAVGRLSPDYYCMDGTIPRQQLPHVLNRISEMSEQYDLAVANVFHAGDGNLHPLILYDANSPGELQRAEEFGGKILELCVEVGGTITGEHGVGVEKLDQMCVQFHSAELQCFHRIKQAFDPAKLLNPGKAVPTLHRCAELGAMHVHHGKLPHPELDRF